ncbi:SRPBCC family protein [Tannerella forsythia]|nr:SRPBCC family protein [Tannerella forsythia]
MKRITGILLIFLGTICMKANSQNNNRMMELRDSITINTTIAAVSDWFENLDTNFVRWNVRHKEFKYLTGGKEVGDKVYFAQCVEGVWYKVKAVITEKQMDDNLFNLTVKSTTGLGVITFRAEKQPDGSVLFTHIESFGARRSFFGNFVNWLFFKALFPKQANWELIKQDMQEDDRNLKRILEKSDF